ncbi:MAG: hypothetical protein IPI68_04620 [Chitinophagaceae bacterium]|nr:hypothetical protein [Chitinophagaceae bacterium]
MANLLAEKGEQVTLLILDNTGNSFYPVSSEINIIQQPLLFGITEKGNMLTRKFSFLKDIQKLKRLIKILQPNHIFATDYQFIPALVLAGAKKHSKIYSWEHHEYSWLKKNSFWNTLLKYSYPKLNSVICQNNTEADHYKKLASVTVIPYLIENNSGKKSSLNNKTILSVGWLIPRKGIDLIMIAAKEVLRRYPEWQWKRKPCETC